MIFQKRPIALSLGLSLFLCLALLITDSRLLVWEKRVNPGETYFVEEHGDLGTNRQSNLVCRYFTGRSVLTSVYWYSPDNLFGKSHCPFVESD